MNTALLRNRPAGAEFSSLGRKWLFSNDLTSSGRPCDRPACSGESSIRSFKSPTGRNLRLIFGVDESFDLATTIVAGSSQPCEPVRKLLDPVRGPLTASSRSFVASTRPLELRTERPAAASRGRDMR